jgi:hypothetical protein
MYCGEDGPSAVKCHPQYAVSAHLFAGSISWTPDQIYVVFQISDTTQTFQVKICTQLQGNSSASTELQGNYIATPGQLQRTARATPAQRQGHSRATSGQLERNYNATPGQLNRNVRVIRANSQGNSSATPGQLQRNARATPAQRQGHSRATPAHLTKYSSETTVFRINLQRKI